MQSRCRLGLQASEGLFRMVEFTFKLAHSQAVGGRPMDLSMGILECPQTTAASFPQSECFNRERLSPGSHTLSFLQYLICYTGQPIHDPECQEAGLTEAVLKAATSGSDICYFHDPSRKHSQVLLQSPFPFQLAEMK